MLEFLSAAGLSTAVATAAFLRLRHSASVTFRNWPSGGASSVNLIGLDFAMSYSGLYRTQPKLAAGVNKIARGSARLPLKTYRLQDDGDRERVRDHDLARLIARPNPAMSGFRWKEWVFGDLALFGNHVSTIERDRFGTPVALWPAQWTAVQVDTRVDDDGRVYVKNYWVTGGSKPIGPLTPRDVFHVRWWNPSPGNPMIGVSPVDQLRRTLMHDEAATRWTTSMFRNGGRPSQVLSTDQKLNREQVATLREQMGELYAGPEKAGGFAVAHSGARWMPGTFSPVDLALIQLRKLNFEEVAAVLDIPPPLLQDLSHATYSNISEQNRMFYQGTLPPYLSLFEEEFGSQLIYPIEPWRELFVEFDMADILRGTPKERAETYQSLRRIYTDNELRKLENLPRIDSPLADTLWKPINEFPLTDGPAPAEERPAVMGIMLQALDKAEEVAASALGNGGRGFRAGRFAEDLRVKLGRDDAAIHVWTTQIAKAVGDTIAGADSPETLRLRMAGLRAALVGPSGED